MNDSPAPKQFDLLRSAWPTYPTAPRLVGGGTSEIYFDRWSNEADGKFELTMDFDIEDHLLVLPLVPSSLIFNIGQRLVNDTEIYPGEPFLKGPIAARSRKVFRGPFDMFRLGLSPELLREQLSFASRRYFSDSIQLFGPHLNTDSLLQSLLMAALSASTTSDAAYLESVGMAVADYLVRRYTKNSEKPVATPLSAWRLRRVMEYIDATIPQEISLADLAAQVGMSRMHFAAQFRAATGLTPHAYVLRRRIRVARPLLAKNELSIGEVGRAVGFASPSHFTEVFRSLVGEPPGRWREIIAQARGRTYLPVPVFENSKLDRRPSRQGSEARRDVFAPPEINWREIPRDFASGKGHEIGLAVTSWTGKPGSSPLEFHADTADSHHVLSVGDRRQDADLFIGGRNVWSGKNASSPVLLTGPRQSRWESIFRGRYNTLRLYISQSLLAECHEDIFGRRPTETIQLFHVDHQINDDVLRQLASVFRQTIASREHLGSTFQESLGVAFASRLVEVYCSKGGRASRPKAGALAPWRQKLVVDYIEENVAKSVRLKELSELVGLSRMHFAEQFKIATGVAPYAYILRRRIECAQTLLSGSVSTAEVAKALGFSSQAHFTTAFKKLVGDTPVRWKRSLEMVAKDVEE